VDLLADYVEHRLPPDVHAELDRHLSRCPRCVAQLKTYQPIVDYRFNALTQSFDPVLGPARTVSGFRLRDGRASYGVSLETFALGFPVHFDWSWRTLFNRDWEDALFAYQGGSSWYRRAQFDLWIGYDF
jgi:hypothetical protein